MRAKRLSTILVGFEVIESPHPLTAHAGTINPHQFLENLYLHAAACPAAT